MATPLIRVQLFRMLQTYRIKVNVADELQKVSVPVTENRFVPPLEEMAGGAVAPIIVLRVRELNPLENFR
jgi:hypothetical protein